MAVVIFGGMS